MFFCYSPKAGCRVFSGIRYLFQKPPQKEIPSAASQERSSGDGTGGKVGGNRNLT